MNEGKFVYTPELDAFISTFNTRKSTEDMLVYKFSLVGEDWLHCYKVHVTSEELLILKLMAAPYMGSRT